MLSADALQNWSAYRNRHLSRLHAPKLSGGCLYSYVFALLALVLAVGVPTTRDLFALRCEVLCTLYTFGGREQQHRLDTLRTRHPIDREQAENKQRMMRKNEIEKSRSRIIYTYCK